MLYNVLYVSPDEPLTPERLSGYRDLILPDVCCLPEDEIRMIREWINQGGHAISLGRVDPRLAETRFGYRDFRELKARLLEGGAIIEAEEVHGLGISLHRRERGYALHLVNYRMNAESRVIEPIPSATFKLGWCPKKAEVHSFPASGAEASIAGNVLTVRNIGIYTIVELQ